MAKIFHRIRQSLLARERFSKYLLYAVGEILLVVIGILIALQINTWSQQRAENSEQVRILSMMKEDLAKDTVFLNALFNSSEKRMSQLDSLMSILADPTKEDSRRAIQLFVEGVGFEGYFNANTGTFDESLTTGSISYISNDTLRQSIFSYYRDVKLNYTDKNSRTQIYGNLFPIFFSKVMATREVMSAFEYKNQLPPLNFQDLGADPEIMGMIIQKRATESFQRADWEIFHQQAEKLLNRITKELQTLDL